MPTSPIPGQDTAEARRERFEVLARDLVEPLRRYLARRTDPATASGVLDDALLVCWRRAEDVPDPALPWAYGVARKCLADVEGATAGPAPADAEVRAALASLTPAEAEVVGLWAWERLDPVAIAGALELAPGAVAEGLPRALGKLRAALGPSDDGRLRARLRASDPAASLPPADPADVERRLHEAATHDDLPESRADGTRGRSRLTWLVAAVAGLVIIGVGAFVLTRGDEETGRPPAPSGTRATVLEAPGEPAGAGRCLPPSADALAADADVAFDGTVTSVSGGRAMLATTHWYAGHPTETAVVRAPPQELQRLLAAIDLEEGQRYLVAGDRRGAVMLCGFSDRYDPRLAALYAEAFGE